jgi:uncharacterized protein YbjT (DUF2867 family)
MMEKQHKKTAIIAGATGLVGEQVINQLLADPYYGKIIAVVRKPMLMQHDKIEQRVVNFEQLRTSLVGIKADHGFCCLGTTIKAAGSKEKQFRVDHDYVIEFAQACQVAGVNRFGAVSSIGADASSSNFYLRTKGQMEADLQKISFEGLYILQPSLLLGERMEHRTGEKAATIIMKLLNPLFVGGLKKYRGVQASDVAACMIRVVKSDESSFRYISSNEIN